MSLKILIDEMDDGWDEKLQQFVDELKKSAKIEYIEPEDSTESHSGH